MPYMEDDCPKCNGGWIMCLTCKGGGYVNVDHEHTRECSCCQGQGGWDCPRCNGTAKVKVWVDADRTSRLNVL